MLNVCRFAMLLAMVGAILSGQVFSAGIRVGVPLNGLVTASGEYSATTSRYTIGPAVQFAVPYGFRIGVDLLYKHMEQEFGFRVADVHRWELPVIVKHRLPLKGLDPSIGLGVSFNRVAGISGTPVAEMRHRGTIAFVAAVSFDKRVWRVHIEPEFRLSHWTDRNFGVYDAPLHSNLNQAEVLVGFRL